MKRMYVVIAAILLVGCVGVVMQFSSSDGEEVVLDPYVPTASAANVDYDKDVKPILEQRCVVCHGCYDAPCQAKFTSIEGIQRGATTSRVYAPRAKKAEPTRLYEDAHSEAEWRKKGFFPMLNDSQQNAGLIAKMLQLKEKHPLPAASKVPESLDVSLTRKGQCTPLEGFGEYTKKTPLGGMPYALPGLDKSQYTTLMDWLASGAKYKEPSPLPASDLAEIKKWEDFLNQDSLQARLMSRYIYEHIYIGHLYFDNLPERRYFKLVRSRTPTGQPIDIIATRRPYDDPGAEPFYYRLSLEKETIIAKTHMPYLLNAERMANWKRWFLDVDSDLQEFPSYSEKKASNPFLTFRSIPSSSRYKFMLDEAQFTIMGFIKGPVCRGDRALGVINDQTWVVFVDPDNELLNKFGDYVADNSDYLRLPAGEGSTTSLLIPWRKYLRLQKSYLKKKTEYLEKEFATAKPLDLDYLWDGNGNNSNAALTIFRHKDGASVVKGFVGDTPKTAWVIPYHLLERIHYLLVAGFDTFGNIGHLLNTRLYMDFLRMEGEANFLSFLPKSIREKERDHWYRGDEDSADEFIQGKYFSFDRETGIPFKTNQPKAEFFDLVKSRLQPVLETRYQLDSIANVEQRTQLQRLSALKGMKTSWLSPITNLSISDKTTGKTDFFTIIHNDGHRTVSYMLGHDKALLPEEDSLAVVKGFVGDHPNTFMEVEQSELKAFVDTVEGLDSEQAYAKLLDRFGIRRTSPKFWQHSDKVLDGFRKGYPLEAGILDYNRLENR